jgi:hypothetical protein
MKNLFRKLNLISQDIKSETLNNSINTSNEIQFDICWWNKSFALEWWNKNGHFNDTLYRDYLSAKVESENRQKN